MAKVSYVHQGWTGVPYESDFSSKWGLVRREEMLDCSDCVTASEAAERARAGGFSYIIVAEASRAGNRLFRIRGKNTPPRCVYALLEYMQSNAEKANAKYRGSAEQRVRQLVRVAKNRAEKHGIPFDLDPNDLVRRALLGYCEVTGAKFNLLDVHSAFAPSLDQTVPRGGYTKVNVKVVCAIYNLMKSDFPAAEIETFTQVMATKATRDEATAHPLPSSPAKRLAVVPPTPVDLTSCPIAIAATRGAARRGQRQKAA